VSSDGPGARLHESAEFPTEVKEVLAMFVPSRLYGYPRDNSGMVLYSQALAGEKMVEDYRPARFRPSAVAGHRQYSSGRVPWQKVFVEHL
jgi:hypothetical protein